MATRPGTVGGKTTAKFWAWLLVLASILPGFTLGAWLGARLLVPASAGLAGGAMVLWYGLLGAAIALAGAPETKGHYLVVA
jgi:hypothetical protein